MEPFLTILICLMLAYFLAEVFKKLGLPRVVGQIIAGLILGIGFIKAYVFNADSLEIIDFLANLGLIFLFYYVGLETNFKSFTKNFKKSIFISVFNTSLPFIAGFLLAKYGLNLDILPSIIIGVSLSVSAQSVSIDLLEELRLLKSKLGNLIITAGAVDDILELMLVTLLLGIFYSSITHLGIIRFLLDMSIFLAVLTLAKLIFIPYSLKFFDIEKSSTSRFMLSTMIVLGVALLSHHLGMGLFIGAMAAGIIVRQTISKEMIRPNWEEQDIAKSTHIIAFGFLLPLFFVKIGITTELHLILSNFKLIILFIIIALLGTVIGTVIATWLNKGTFKEGLILGFGLSPKGDLELAIITLALENSIITNNIYTSLVIMSLSTTILAPIIFKKLVQTYGTNLKAAKSS